MQSHSCGVVDPLSIPACLLWHGSEALLFSPTALVLARASHVDQAAPRMETFAHSRTHVTYLALRATASWLLATAE